jgi:exopolysaccharide production protein ExoQ
MQPNIALGLWVVLLIALLWRDPARERGTSIALWLAVISFFILTSRLPSQWLGLVRVGTYAQALEEGNALDRTVYLILIAISAAILLSRSFNWTGFWQRNVALLAFLLFALLSVAWSDFPFIAFKRWFRDLTHYMTLLVVLSDPRPLEAIRTVFRRSCYILISLSVLLVKYFQEIGRQYELYSGLSMYVGATTSKNMLGVLCVFSALFFVWDTFQRWADRRNPQTKRVLWVNAAYLLMTVWLLDKASSATSNVSLLLGLLVMVAAHRPFFRRRPAWLLATVPASFVIYSVLTFSGVDINGWVATSVGRDPTLTGRTFIWQTLLNYAANPWLGAGYETFWMGSRLQQIWPLTGAINHAHNGYLNVYLNLGIVGLASLTVFLLVCYRRVCQQFRNNNPLGILGVSAWTVLLFYNVTEAAFPTGPLWLLVITAAVIVPQREPSPAAVRSNQAFARARAVAGARGAQPAGAGHSRVARPATGNASASSTLDKRPGAQTFPIRRRWSGQ